MTIKRANLHICCERGVRLDEQAGLALLKKILADVKPDLLILDPLYTFHRAEENSAKEVAPLLTGIKDALREAGAACIVVHHQGKPYEGKSGSQPGFAHRGSSAFADVPDGSWTLARKGDSGVATMKFELRNDEPPDHLQLTLDRKSLWWRTANGIEKAEKPSLTVDAIVSRLAHKTKKKDLVAVLMREFEISRKTVEAKVNEAVHQGRIIRELEGKEATYRRHEQHSHPRNP